MRIKAWSFFWVSLIVYLFLWSIISLIQVSNYATPLILPKTLNSKEVVVIAIDNASIEEFGSWPWPRNFQAQLISKILEANPKKIGVDILYPTSYFNQEGDAELYELLENPKIVSASSSSILSMQAFNSNINTGNIDFAIEEDGYIRAYTSFEQPSLAEKMLDTKLLPFTINPNIGSPTTLSATDFLSKPELNSVLENKYVLLGSTAIGLNDFQNVSGKGQIPGVVLHGIVIQQAISGQFWREVNFQYYSIAFGLIIVVFLYQIRNLPNIYYELSIILAISLIFLIYVWAYSKQIILDLNWFLVAIITLFTIPFGSWVNKISLERNQIKKTLSLYISPSVMQRLLSDPSQINLGGQRYETSIMFTDVRGFTTLSESTPNVEEIAKTLNQVLSLQTEVILKNEGVVDKYIGDAVMAFWGAPIPNKNHAYQAILSACQIQNKVNEFNQTHNQNWQLGVGINTGTALVGNFGSEKRLDYTAIGDTVNTSARIESITKHYGAKILISQTTLNSLTEEQKEEFSIVEVDQIVLKGKQKFIKLYEILGFKSEFQSQAKQRKSLETHNQYSNALQAYYKGDFALAIELATQILNTQTDFKRAKVILDRSKELQNEPKSNWVGVWEMDKK